MASLILKTLQKTTRLRSTILMVMFLPGILLCPLNAQDASFSLYFAHFGAGPVGGLELITELTLINALTHEVEGVEVEFFKQDGTPNSVKIEGETTDKLTLSVDAESGRRLVVESADGILRVGWIRVSSPVALGGVLQF